MRMFVQLNSDVVAMDLEAVVSGATTPSYKKVVQEEGKRGVKKRERERERDERKSVRA